MQRGLRVWLIASFTAALLAACGGGGGGGGGSSSNGGGATVVAAPVIVAQPQAPSVSDGQAASFSVTAVGTGTTYQYSRNGVPIAGATSATYTIPNVQLSDDGATFSVAVTNAGGTVQSTPVTLHVAAIAPSLANNAATTVSVSVGQPATFAVTASGSLPLTFQWRRGGVAIDGATSSTYTIGATTIADNGAVFDVVVTNSAGSITSAPFTLVVTSAALPPTGLSLPQFFTARAGNIATITVSPSGTAPFTYQWFRDGQPIPGANSASYTISNVQLTDNNAQFSVQVTNASGSTTSAIAILLVLPRVGLAVVAGNVGGPGSLDGPQSAARFTSVTGVAIDNAGNLFVVDGSTIRELSASGTVSTIAGSPLATGTTDGTGTAARFGAPQGLLVDGAGTILVADTDSHTLRRITAAGVVTTASGAAGVAGSTDGPVSVARFNAPRGLALDGSGNVFVADTGNHVIRRIDRSGTVTTLAGSAGASGFADGTGGAARFNSPRNIAVDAAGIVYVADTGNNTIRSITPAGVVTTIAGSATASGSADGTGAAASFSAPTGISVDAAGNLYVTDAGSFVVRKIAAGGVVTTIAGSVNAVGSADGTGSAARFAAPLGLASDSAGTSYVADRDNFSIRRVTASGVVSTLGGAPTVQGSADGTGAGATFNVPAGVAVDAALNVYVVDQANSTIRRISVGGPVTTIAGSVGTPGSADGSGAAARFATPAGIAIDAAGTLYVADTGNHTIRKVTAAGVVTTLAGTAGVSGAADGTGAAASFRSPSALTVDASGNVYVVDDNPTVRQITPAGVVTTIAGAASRFGSADGPVATASFMRLRGIAIDGSGNLYVTDAGSATVRKIAGGAVTTLAGTAGSTGSVDGAGGAALFTTPTGIAIDGSGQLYVSDPGTHTIRRIDPSGNVVTVVGTPDGLRGVRVGDLPGHLDRPLGVAFDRNGSLYTTDANGVIRVTFQ